MMDTYRPWNIYGKSLPFTSPGRSSNNSASLSNILTPFLATHWRKNICVPPFLNSLQYLSVMNILPSPVQGTRLGNYVGIHSVCESVSHHFYPHPKLFLQVSVILWEPTAKGSREWKWKFLRNTFLQRDLMTTPLPLQEYSCILYCTLFFLKRM